MEESQNKEIKLVAGFLASALDMEDKMSADVYGIYLNREVFPANLEEEVFEMLKGFLTTLIKDTEEHKNKFLDLKNRLNNASS